MAEEKKPKLKTEVPARNNSQLATELRALVKPLQKWLKANYDPHTKVIVDLARVDLIVEIVGAPTNDTDVFEISDFSEDDS